MCPWTDYEDKLSEVLVGGGEAHVMVPWSGFYSSITSLLLSTRANTLCSYFGFMAILAGVCS